MKPSEIQEAFADAGSDTTSLKNLIYVSLNNGKSIHVTEEMKEKGLIKFNGDLSLLIETDEKYVLNTMTDFKPRSVKVYMNAEFIETLIFAMDEEDVLKPNVYGGLEVPLAHNEPKNANPDTHIYGMDVNASQPQRHETRMQEEPEVTENGVVEVEVEVGDTLVLENTDVTSYVAQKLEEVSGHIGIIDGLNLHVKHAGKAVIVNKVVTVEGSLIKELETKYLITAVKPAPKTYLDEKPFVQRRQPAVVQEIVEEPVVEEPVVEEPVVEPVVEEPVMTQPKRTRNDARILPFLKKPDLNPEALNETIIDLGLSQRTLAQGSTLQLNYSIMPEQGIQFISTNEEIATVTQNGLITAIASTGQCRIKAISEDGTESYVIIKTKEA